MEKAWPDCWDAIGGHVEDGETPEMAAVREVQEEVGVRPSRLLLIDTFPEPRPDLYGDALHHIFAVTAWTGGAPANICDEHTEIAWFSVDEIDRLKPLAGTRYPLLARQAVNFARL